MPARQTLLLHKTHGIQQTDAEERTNERVSVHELQFPSKVVIRQKPESSLFKGPLMPEQVQHDFQHRLWTDSK
jgi:hypothetical protein